MKKVDIEKRRAYQRKLRSWANPKSKKRRAEWNNRKHLRVKYGITPERKQEMIDAQNGLCANLLCGVTLIGRFAHVDHCHITGKVRGILCNNCNIALGLLRENPNRLTGLANYIINYSALDRKFT